MTKLSILFKENEFFSQSFYNRIPIQLVFTLYVYLQQLTYSFFQLQSSFRPFIRGPFMLSANDIFILFFTTQFNPFYLFSTRFPNPEELNGIKILLFSVFELICYFVVWRIALINRWYYFNSKYNQYVSLFDNRRKFAEWFANLVVVRELLVSWNYSSHHENNSSCTERRDLRGRKQQKPEKGDQKVQNGRKKTAKTHQRQNQQKNQRNEQRVKYFKYFCNQKYNESSPILFLLFYMQLKRFQVVQHQISTGHEQPGNMLCMSNMFNMFNLIVQISIYNLTIFYMYLYSS
ncbi:Transmembrane_domain-containing protein [Hexamita inflata]|uniref:Transmembrane domain-containing protein n=1 Tax=Hexamita inflata TaxID=28002 RepID=A0AA86PUQ2_9EUKA|nr:Transmembrane domain-containing protein [Hexamita inflata]